MQEEKEIIFTLTGKGLDTKIELETKGFVGATCINQVEEQLAKSLGITTAITYKPEHNIRTGVVRETTRQSQKQVQR